MDTRKPPTEVDGAGQATERRTDCGDRTIFLNRTPVLDPHGRIWGYHLDFIRLGPRMPDGPAELDQVPLSLAETLRGFDPVGLTGNRPAIVRADHGLGDSTIDEQWQKRIILQMPAAMISREAPQIDDQWHDRKPLFCVADFILIENIIPLLPSPVFLKVNIEGRGVGQLHRVAKAVEGLQATTIATSVDTRKTFAMCSHLGFNLFQGEFFAEPDGSRRPLISPSQALLLELSANTVNDANADIAKVESIFKKNPDLAFSLMNLVHAAYFRVSEHVSSIRQAIALLGFQNIHKWVALMLFTIDRSDPLSNPLFERAFIRARTMELLAGHLPDKSFADAAYLTGIFSLMPALLDLPFDQILQKASLTEEITQALLTRTGACGQLITLAEKLERGRYAESEEQAKEMGLSLVDLLSARTDAILEYQIPGSQESKERAGLDNLLDLVAADATEGRVSNPADHPKNDSWFRRVMSRFKHKHAA